MKKLIVFLLTAVILLGCTACTGRNNGEYPVKIANYTFAEKPDSIVCLNDSVADILIACGYSDRITARSDECSQPEISAAPSVGSKNRPNSQRILDVEPDVVFADKTLEEDVRSRLEESNVSVLTMMPAEDGDELTLLYENICALTDGNKSGRENGAEKSKSILLTMDDLQRIIPESDIVVTACYLYNLDGAAASDSSFDGKLLSYANATNVCAAKASPEENLEKIKLSNPDYIFCAAGLKDKLPDDANFKNLKAVKNGKVFEIDSLLIQRQGNSLTEVLSFMIENMYPDLTKPQQPAKPESSGDASKPESSKSESSDDASKPESSKPESSDNASKPESSKPESSKPESSEESSKPESSEESSKVEADDSLDIYDGLEYGYGESGSDVEKIQNRLMALGYFDAEPTGYYGDFSEEAFRDFESANGLEIDGYASTEDLRLLFSADVKPASAQNQDNP